MRKLDVTLAVAGVGLVVAGVLVRTLAYPAVDKVPGHLDVTAQMTGTATIFGQSPPTPGSAPSPVRHVDVQATRAIKAQHSTDDTIVVSDDITVTYPAPMPARTTHHDWALSRKTAESAVAPAGWHSDSHTGLVAGFPPQLEARDYQMWDSMTGRSFTLSYVGHEKVSGRDTLKFQMAASGQIADPQMLHALPPALPRQAVAAAMAQSPAAGSVTATDAGGASTAAVPTAYEANNHLTAWVDAATGIGLKVDQDQQVFAVPVGTQLRIPLTATQLTSTPADIAAHADTAHTVGLLKWWLRLGGPVILVVAGLLVLAFLAARIGARRRSARQAASGANL